MEDLNCLPPSIEPKPTGHIIEQIKMVQKNTRKGFNGEVNGCLFRCE